MKCLSIRPGKKSTRYKAVKEWFLMKLSSLAGIGPKVEDYFGFDILMFDGCIEFGMEKLKS